jgi:O-acetyl-ADP-ribose deacetylase (regulator of RNase III)
VKVKIKVKVILGNICYPRADALIIPANTNGTMFRGRPAQVVKDGLSSIAKEAKQFAINNVLEPGTCFSTKPGRLNRRGLKKIYHAVIKRLQGDFTSIHIVRNALNNSLQAAVNDDIQIVAICGIGIEPGELDPKTVAMITFEEVNKFINKIEIKIIDENEEFINEINKLSKEKNNVISK